MQQKILFDHFMDGINMAANDFYDLHPLVCKKYSSADILTMFSRFQNLVASKDPFWEVNNKLMFIMDLGSLREVNLQNEIYYLINEEYRTDSVWMFFNSTSRASFCPASQKSPSFESSGSFYKGPGISLKYLSIASKLFKHYGENFYMEIVRPHTDVLRDAIVEILGLKKFPNKLIRKNKNEQFKGSLDFACGDGNEDISYFIEKAKEYFAFAETVVSDMKEYPAYHEVFALDNELKSLISRVKDLSAKLHETVIPAVEMAIYCSND